MNRILEALGLDEKPKTFGGRLLRGVQIVSIPLFFIVLAIRPLAEERNQRVREDREKLEEIKRTQRANEVKELMYRENPQLKQMFDDLKNKDKI
ncbi:hypothetical protein SAMD00019534_076410 [Acytostelium subglobosum LB1]|uniref:hypothetical protein n=1 Tax=Acytostelium subglobosum LB1 TaxID=1410327 RepID=UPI000644961F|nr:hypothetical protein SAMD00019534_076410 [Acytostelium subglobosum LB1]GAM24466.1 hypothetical protein SAMD00019534_076410 [Acytostelium subglobosum LB1]|eukprot:XP_012752792.1 hypothetical protein SAMD00019534_076410 [Acytostelium subglobosum LB1]